MKERRRPGGWSAGVSPAPNAGETPAQQPAGRRRSNGLCYHPPSRPNMPLEHGARLGPYLIDAEIGAGGMGHVFRATDTRLDRAVAIKVLPEHRWSDRRVVDVAQVGRFGGFHHAVRDVAVSEVFDEDMWDAFAEAAGIPPTAP